MSIRIRTMVLLSAAAVALPPADLAGQGIDSLPRVLPVDEAVRDPAFFAFRAGLQRAIAERDTASLVEVVDPMIKLSFGGDAGIERFREMWLESPDADVWAELGEVLAFGGRFWGDSMYYAPYTFHPFAADDRQPDYDPYEALIAIGDAVPVLVVPDPVADTLAVLSFHLVRHEWRSQVADPPAGWTAVRLADASLGFVRANAVRSPIDYRAIFARRNGRWRMIIFVAGD